MTFAPQILYYLNVLCALLFTGVTALLMGAAAVRRLRTKRVCMRWRPPELDSLPVWPTAFMAAALGLATATRWMGYVLPPEIVGGYLLGALLWMVSVLTASAVTITDAGILLHRNYRTQGILWAQVQDYFCCKRGRQIVYVFFYVTPAQERRRIELAVPLALARRFRTIMENRMNTRFVIAPQLFGKEALEE